ncbi:MAG: hypothetical protein WKG07_40610 [Hymenobacter sp.]
MTSGDKHADSCVHSGGRNDSRDNPAGSSTSTGPTVTGRSSPTHTPGLCTGGHPHIIGSPPTTAAPTRPT